MKLLAIAKTAERATRKLVAGAESSDPALRRAFRTKVSMSPSLHFSPTQMQ